MLSHSTFSRSLYNVFRNPKTRRMKSPFFFNSHDFNPSQQTCHYVHANSYFTKITEIKQKLDGSSESFELELWDYTAEEFIVARWVASEPAVASKYGIPVGSYSWGVWPLYHHEGGWCSYRHHNPDGRLNSWRFDCVEKTYLTKEGDHLEFVFHDLLLDAWVEPCGSVRFEDEDEVNECLSRDALSLSQQSRIDEFRRLLGEETSLITDICNRAIHNAIAKNPETRVNLPGSM